MSHEYSERISMSLPFTYALVDEDGTVIRQFRWSVKEAKWHKEQGKNVIKLEIKKEPVTGIK